MDLKDLLLIVFTLSTIHGLSEDLASCQYRITEDQGYACSLTANSVAYEYDNPGAVEKFDEIHGEHVQGATDDNVTAIENSDSFHVLNFPAIICEKFNELRKIEIKNSGIEKIPSASLDKCDKLEEVQIASSKLARLDDELLGNCEFLRILVVKDSELKHVPVDFLTSCKHLQKLDLSGNELNFLVPNLLKSQESLETLNLSSNKLQGFPKNFFKPLKSLRILDISNNSILVLSSNWLNNLENLVELNLSHNSIRSIPKSFIKLQVDLRILDLSYNQLAYIHADSFDTYPDLIDLNTNGVPGIEQRLVKNILKANKTLKVYRTYCTRDIRVPVGHKYPEHQTNEELLEFLDYCFDSYEPRNEDEAKGFTNNIRTKKRRRSLSTEE